MSRVSHRARKLNQRGYEVVKKNSGATRQLCLLDDHFKKKESVLTTPGKAGGLTTGKARILGGLRMGGFLINDPPFLLQSLG